MLFAVLYVYGIARYFVVENWLAMGHRCPEPNPEQKGQAQGSRIDVVSHAIHRQRLARHHARMVRGEKQRKVSDILWVG